VRLRPEDLPKPGGNSGDNTYAVVAVPKQAVFQAPPGFVVEVFAEGLVKPRWMQLTPDGKHLLVTEKRGAQIRLLKVAPDSSRGTIEGVFASNANGLNQALGMGFVGERFLVANTDGIYEFPYSPGQKKLEGRGTPFGPRVPKSGYNNHWTRNLVIDPVQQKIFLSVGSGTNASVEELPRAAIVEMDYAGKNHRYVATGMRNPIGFDLHPVTNELYSTVTERDELGDDLVPDFLTRVQDGGFYGWPYAYLSPKLLDPRHVVEGLSTRPDLVAKTIEPDVLFRAHSSPIGFRFARGENFPAPYRHGGFVALRGSWNRSQGVGFEVAFVPFDDKNRPVGTYQTFVKGFLRDSSKREVWGRPAGIYFLPDGSLLFTDDGNGENERMDVYGSRIYRVRYLGAPSGT